MTTDRLLSFGALLKQYRRAAELSQEELGERAGYSAVYIRKLEGGARRPTATTAELLAHALDLDAEQQALFQRAASGTPGAGAADVVPVERPPRGDVHTFLIADIREYTRFTHEHGDEAAGRLATAFAAIAREAVSAHGGDVIETRGDEILAVFLSPRGALRAAITLRDRCLQLSIEDPSLPLAVGVGVDSGEAVRVEGGYRGGALNLAARLCGLAAAGEIFVSETVVGLARKVEDIAYRDRGRVQLKGFAEPVSVVQVLREEELEEISRRETFDAVLVDGAHGAGDAVARELEAAGLKILVPSGAAAHAQAELSEALRLTGCVLVLIASDGLEPIVGERLLAALGPLEEGWRPRVALVLLPGAPDPFDSSTLPSFLSTRTWIDLRTSDLRRDDVASRLTQFIEGPAAGADRPAPTGQPPYRGLESFDESTAEFFFGRAADTQRLVERLKATNFLAVLGPSGSGKSSVVKAGLIPAIRAGSLPTSDTWTVRAFAPGAHPLAALAAQVLRLYPGDTMQRTVDEMARDSRTLSLATSLAFADSPTGRRVVWVVDQLEEIFTLCPDEQERSQFLANLLYAASAPGGRSLVVLTMRADFYHRCAQYPELAARIGQSQYLVGPMDRDALRQAIEEPAWRVGLEFEQGLVDRILEDVAGQPGALPLLEYALLELWERREGHILTLEGYRESGGVQGAIAKRAEATYAGLDPAQQAVTRLILLRLTQAGEGTADTRRRADMRELESLSGSPADVERVVNAMVDARLVTAERDRDAADTEARATQGEDRRVEVSHEALIRGWPRLRQWIDEDRAGLRTHRRLTEAAQEWDRLSRDQGSLYRGATLTVAAEWADRNPGALNQLEREFLEASIAQQEGERRARLRRLWLAAGGLVAALVIISLAAVVALVQRQQALHDRDAARSAVIAQRSTALLPTDRRLATLLAVEAVRTSSTDVAVWALRDALASFSGHLRLSGHENSVLTAFYSPDGRRIVTASADQTARVWDARSGRTLLVLKGHRGPLSDAQFSPDGRRIVTASADGTARIWDAQTGRVIHVLRGHHGAVRSAAFSPDGSAILTAGADRTARLWDAATGWQIRVLRGHTAALNWAAYSPNGREVISGSDDGTARIWRVATGRQIRVLTQSGEPVTFVAFSPDGRQAVTGGTVARLWNLSTGSAQVLRVPVNVIGVGGFSPDGRWFTAGGIEREAAPPSAWVWDATTGSLLARLVRGHTDTVNSAAFSPDGRSLITASSDGTVLIHSCDALRPVNELLALAAARHYRPLTPLERRQYLNQP